MNWYSRTYHWRFDRDTYMWECWLEWQPAIDTVCMSRVGWVTAEAVDLAQNDIRAMFVHQIARKRGERMTYVEV